METLENVNGLLKIEKLSDIVTNRSKIEHQVNGIFEFLSQVHPSSLEGGFQHPIEIRFLERTEKGTRGLHSANLFGLNQKSKEHLMAKIETYKNRSVCMYYSGYQYNYFYTCELKRTTRNGKKYTTTGKPQKIKKESAVGTQELPADFDNLSFEEFSVYNDILKSVGIESVVVFSGHGYQTHILLDKYNEDPFLFGKFTKKLTELGFKVDSSITDSPRILRLPYTVNFKEFDRVQYPSNHPRAVETKLIESTEKRYSVEFIFEKLDGLIEKRKELIEEEDSVALEEFFHIWAPEQPADGLAESAISIPVSTNEPIKKQKEQTAKGELRPKKETEHVIKTEQYFSEAYQHLNFINLKAPINYILMGVNDGMRNDALLFLLSFLRNDLGLTQKKVTETLIIWGESCSPSYSPSFVTSEVERLWQYHNMATFARYTKTLQESFGKLDTVHTAVLDNQIIIENRVLKAFTKLEGAALKVYLTIKLLEKEEDKKEFTKEEISERAEVVQKTVQRAMKSLVLSKLVNKKSSVKKQDGDKVIYSINTLGSEFYGYTKIPTATVELMICKKLSKYEFAFYVYMYMKTWASTQRVFTMSRDNIAEAIGSSSETTISKITDKLAKLKFISKKVDKEGKHIKCEYRLLK